LCQNKWPSRSTSPSGQACCPITFTIKALIGNGTVALLGEQGHWERLREDPALVPAAVEELLRYDSPVQVTLRTATEDVDLDGTAMPEGTPVIVAIGGANRDPGVFGQPDRLIIDRPNASRHLSFSLGIHHYRTRAAEESERGGAQRSGHPQTRQCPLQHGPGSNANERRPFTWPANRRHASGLNCSVGP
jgi:hypothetical protein